MKKIIEWVSKRTMRNNRWRIFFKMGAKLYLNNALFGLKSTWKRIRKVTPSHHPHSHPARYQKRRNIEDKNAEKLYHHDIRRRFDYECFFAQREALLSFKNASAPLIRVYSSPQDVYVKCHKIILLSYPSRPSTRGWSFQAFLGTTRSQRNLFVRAMTTGIISSMMATFSRINPLKERMNHEIAVCNTREKKIIVAGDVAAKWNRISSRKCLHLHK